MLIKEVIQPPNEIDEELVAAAKEHFGLTDNPDEVGYILPDGVMLDLSGRHETGDYRRDSRGRNVVHRGRDYFAGSRLTDHRDLGDLIDAGGTEGMLEFMRRANAVRVMPSVGFSVARTPTVKQITKMFLLAQRWNEPLYLDYGDDSVEVTPPFKPPKLVAAIQKLGLLRK